MIKLKYTDKRYTNINEVYKPLCEIDGRINYFIKLLEKNGFIVQEGSLQYIDILKLVSEGKSSTALGNIVGAPCNSIYKKEKTLFGSLKVPSKCRHVKASDTIRALGYTIRAVDNFFKIHLILL